MNKENQDPTTELLKAFGAIYLVILTAVMLACSSTMK